MSKPAIELLIRSAETCEHNAKIQQQEGEQGQAALNWSNANAYREAAAILANKEDL